ncbi:MAG TPA: GTPase Era [Flavobacteriales bacterium]|nr:GTPase Era [Flavobacteriales bacterium]HMR26252.1 GTPase Era [Flavobacteriales bacterium]
MSHRAGFVNIIGMPNAGKSTLLNALLGEPLAITNPKAQTTRHRILGLINGPDHQLVIGDTPGILEPQYGLQQRMMAAVDEALRDADVLVVLVELRQRPDRSQALLDRARRAGCPLLVLVNKVDLGGEDEVLEACQRWQEALPTAKVVPVSALHGFHVDELRQHLVQAMPEHPPYFPKDELSDRNMRFFVAELVRERILALYKQEVPYSCEVVVNSYEEGATLTRIQADIIVMRESQKAILIGEGGRALRRLGTQAREAIERFVGTKVFLDLKVKADPDWREDKKKLRNYGY